MKNLKVVFPNNTQKNQIMLGDFAKLVDADTDQELLCIQGFSINVPMDGEITVDVRMTVSDIEIG